MSEVEEIKDRLSIVDLIGEYIRVTKAGSNWRALCPFHNEKSPSFMLSEERRSFHCFGCGKGGDIFTFVMEMEGVGFREALEILAPKAGVELKRFEMGNLESREKKDDKAKLFAILELATKWYEKNLWEGKGKEKILRYLGGRGLTDASVKKFRLGYAPDGWRNILHFLTKRGYTISEINKTGLLVEKNSDAGIQKSDHYDRFRDRIMFPVQDVMGRVVGYSARVAPGGDEKNAKYINTPQGETYDKSRVLYGLNFAKTEIKKRDEVILVEGNMDVIASQQAGFENTIAVSGTALTLDQIKTIRRYSENLRMAFDMDQAGQAAAKKSARICLENDLDVTIVLLPSGKDAADVIRENKAIWEESVKSARSIIDYFFEDVFSRYDSQDPVGKKKIASELLNVIKDIASPVERSHWIGILSEKLGVEAKVLIEVLENIKPEKRFEQRQKAPEESTAMKLGAVEKRFLGLAVLFPRETAANAGKLTAEHFSSPVEKKIFQNIKSQKGTVGFEELKKNIKDYEAQKYIDEAVFAVEIESQERSGFDAAVEIKEAVLRLLQEKTKRQIAGLSKDVKAAETTGNKAAVDRLMLEFKKLSQDLNT